MHCFSHGSSGNAFHRVGPAHEKDRRPYLSRLYRGIFSWPECAVQRGSYVEINDARQAGVFSRRALNTIKLVSVTFAPKPALQIVWFFQIQSASQNGGGRGRGKE